MLCVLYLIAPPCPLISIAMPSTDTQWAYWKGIRDFYENKKVNFDQLNNLFFPHPLLPSNVTHLLFSLFTPRFLSNFNRVISKPRSETPRVPTSPTRRSMIPVFGSVRPRRPWSPVSSRPARISETLTFCKYAPPSFAHYHIHSKTVHTINHSASSITQIIADLIYVHIQDIQDWHLCSFVHGRLCKPGGYYDR